jgi:hypothetical protein
MWARSLMLKGLDHTDNSAELFHRDLHTLFYGKPHIKRCILILQIMEMNYRQRKNFDNHTILQEISAHYDEKEDELLPAKRLVTVKQTTEIETAANTYQKPTAPSSIKKRARAVAELGIEKPKTSPKKNQNHTEDKEKEQGNREIVNKTLDSVAS